MSRRRVDPNRLVQDNFYSEGNVDLMERTIYTAIRQDKNYELSRAEIDGVLNKGMEYAIRTTPPRQSNIPVKTYIMKLLNKKAIQYCLENVNIRSNIKNKDTEDPRHRSRSFRSGSGSGRDGRSRPTRRHGAPSSRGSRSIAPLIESRDDFDPGRKTKSMSESKMDRRFKSLQRKRGKYDPEPSPNEKRRQGKRRIQEPESEEESDYFEDEEAEIEDFGDVVGGDYVDEALLDDIKNFMDEREGNVIEDGPDDPDDESFRDQMPNTDPLPQKSIGHVVPVSKIPQTFTIYSGDREQKDSTNPNDYRVKLAQSYRGISHIELVSANIPKTGYIVNSTNNIINFTDSGGAPALIATLTPGNYTADELATEIDTQMTTSSAATGATDAYTVANNAKTSKFTIVQAGGGPFEMQFNGGTELFGPNSNTRAKLLANSSGDILGFGPNDQTGATSYTSSKRYNLAGPDALFLEIEELGGRVQGSNHNMTNVFAHVQFSASSSAINFHTNQSDTKNVKYFSPPKGKLEKLTIRWRDYLGNLYDFNGIDHFIEMDVYSVEQGR